MKTHYCNFSDLNYKPHQDYLIKHVKENQIFDNTFAYSKEWLTTTDFYKENKKILDYERLCGYALWKPYVILETLKKADYGDIVVYMDCGDVPVHKEINDVIKKYMFYNDQYFITTVNQNREYTKRDCFVLMNCDSEYYWNSLQMEDGFLSFKKTDFNIELVEEWMKYCSDERIITDMPNTCGLENFSEFKDHRHDQSIISLLQLKHELPTNNFVRHYIRFNVLEHVKGVDHSNGVAKWKNGSRV